MNLNLNLSQVTNSLRGLWEELVERRLWPIAVALVVAIIALPVVLSKPAATNPAAPPAPASPSASSPLAVFQPVVSTDGKKSSEIRKNLGRFKAKNPFTPKAGTPGSSSAGTATVAVPATTGGGSAAATDAGSSGTSGSSFVPSDTSGTSNGSTGSTGDTTDSAGVMYFTYTVDVRFGKVGQADAKTLTRFRALPSSEDPVIVFMGVRNDGETAVFLVSAAATTTGDGDCQPSDDQCTFLYMKKGDKQTIETVGGDNEVVDYELEMRDVNVKTTKGPEEANSSGSERAAHKSQVRTHDLKRSIRSIELLDF